jgi:hypothetical protein
MVSPRSHGAVMVHTTRAVYLPPCDLVLGSRVEFMMTEFADERIGFLTDAVEETGIA